MKMELNFPYFEAFNPGFCVEPISGTIAYRLLAEQKGGGSFFRRLFIFAVLRGQPVKGSQNTS